MRNYAGIDEITAKLAEKRGITKKLAEEFVRDFIEIMKEEFLNENRDGIQFVDFITLKKVIRKERIGRNPKNPEQTYKIPARVSLKASFGKKFEKLINKE